ncbi:MAG TPA: DUF3352 domain-containing protein [Candidatus Limnocylindria bacterium]|nr:DUF3352 domain-containing protein [Candidatus Limnocylindria bacterium]
MTTLLALVGGAVIAAYLLVFSVAADRAARAVPADVAAYATLYLQPSAGQMLNLAELLGRVPGFADSAALEGKIHEITARLLSGAGIDYEADVRPWLGQQASVAIRPSGLDPAEAEVLAVVGVTDAQEADAALGRLADDLALAAQATEHQGVELMVGAGTSWALLDDVLLVGSNADVVRAGLDADAGRAPALSRETRFNRAMSDVPADHLAAAYVDLQAFGSATGVAENAGGYSTASLALVVDPDGLRLVGSAPFDASRAPDEAQRAFELGDQQATLAEWMPVGTQAGLVMFGLGQSLLGLEAQLASGEAGDQLADLLNQARAVAAFGLGVSVDDELLPLLDRETGLAVSGLDGEAPRGVLLLRPSDASAAEATLARVRDALRQRGASVVEVDVGGIPVTTVELPTIGSVSYAVRDGVAALGLAAEDLAAAFEARETGASLAGDARYAAAWSLAGERAGNEAWVDAAALVEAYGEQLGLTGEARDILLQADALAMTAPARRDESRSELHVVLTVR